MSIFSLLHFTIYRNSNPNSFHRRVGLVVDGFFPSTVYEKETPACFAHHKKGQSVVMHTASILSCPSVISRHDGMVTWEGFECSQGLQIEGTGVYRINGNLAVARAIGDIDYRPWLSGALVSVAVAVFCAVCCFWGRVAGGGRWTMWRCVLLAAACSHLPVDGLHVLCDAPSVVGDGGGFRVRLRARACVSSCATSAAHPKSFCSKRAAGEDRDPKLCL